MKTLQNLKNFSQIKISALLVLGVLAVSTVRADEMTLKNNVTFYGDNTEFFEPFRVRETILGQQFGSFLDAAPGTHTELQAGLFADHRSAEATATTVNPILSFRFHDNDSALVFGTLQTLHRHGMIEPLEVTTLELTRPVEYGLQWLQTGKDFQMDAFLNWQDLLTPNQRETFDYGGSADFPLEPFLTLLGQYHGYHVGGAAYPGPVWNNFAAVLGPQITLEALKDNPDSLMLLGLTNKTINSTTYPGPEVGYAFYAKAVVWLFPGFNLFGIDWIGKDFYSVEGDSNYNSLGSDGIYYKSNRTYEELGAQFVTEIESGINFDVELRSHWIEDSWANSFRILAQVPFDVGTGVRIQQAGSSKEGQP